MVIFAPAGFPRTQLDADVTWSCEAMARLLPPPQGRVVARGATLPRD
jgi:hypothetical protein